MNPVRAATQDAFHFLEGMGFRQVFERWGGVNGSLMYASADRFPWVGYDPREGVDCMFGVISRGTRKELVAGAVSQESWFSLLRDSIPTASLIQLMGLAHRDAITSDDPVPEIYQLGVWWSTHGRSVLLGDDQTIRRLRTHGDRFIRDLDAWCVQQRAELLWLVMHPLTLPSDSDGVFGVDASNEDLEVGRTLVKGALTKAWPSKRETEISDRAAWAEAEAARDVEHADGSVAEIDGGIPFLLLDLSLRDVEWCSSRAMHRMEGVRQTLSSRLPDRAGLALRLVAKRASPRPSSDASL